MDQRPNRGTAATLTSWRTIPKGPQDTSARGITFADANQQQTWRTVRDSTTFPIAVPPVPQEDGFTAVSKRRQSLKHDYHPLRPLPINAAPMPSTKARTTAYRQVKNTGLTVSPPSVAAMDRGSVYANRGKALSNYKQSCLPTNERDPLLTEVERNKGVRLTKEMFKPGMIIRCAHHEQDFVAGGAPGASDATLADKYRTDSKFGTIFTKYRKMIVVALYHDHYVAVPLYTHNGRGLEKKPKPDEFVSVQDHRVPGAFKALSVHQPVVTEQINDGVNKFHPKSTAHFTYPVSRKYGLPVIVEGQVRRVSLASLATLVNTYSTRATR